MGSDMRVLTLCPPILPGVHRGIIFTTLTASRS